MIFNFKTRQLARNFKKNVKTNDIKMTSFYVYKCVKKAHRKYFAPFHGTEYQLGETYKTKMPLKISCERDSNNKAIKNTWYININQGFFAYTDYNKAVRNLKRGQAVLCCIIPKNTKYLIFENDRYQDIVSEEIYVIGEV